MKIRGQAIRGDRCEVEPISFFFLVSPHFSLRQIRNFKPPPNLHRSTANVRVVGIETSCTQSLIGEPIPESNDRAMSRLRIREMTCQFSHWPTVAPTSLNVRTRNSQTYTDWYAVYRVGL